jgi:glycosyltransferase involved in cell wall biosynthesis
MYKDNSIAVVVPAYNEEGHVGEVIDTIPSFVDVAYVVEDGSTDGTWEEIRDHAARVNETRSPEAPDLDRVVVPIRHEENRGVGGAIKTGYLRAREDEVEVTAVLGGDGQMNPEVLAKYIDPVAEGDADYAKGNRFMRPEELESMPRFRFVGNTLLSYLTKFASGYWKTMDPQNGYTAISLEALEEADIEGMYEYYGYCNDLLVKLNVENLRVADVARSSTYAYEGGWKSHIDYGEYIPRVSGMLFRNFLWRLKHKYLLRDFHPLVAFYSVGALVSAAGLLGAIRQSYRRDVGAGPGSWVLTLLLGVAFVLAGSVLDMRDNEDLELQTEADDYERPADV